MTFPTYFKLAVTSLCLLILTTGCNNDCDLEPNLDVDQEQLATDIETIDQYLAENGIDAEEHPSGIRYVISREGTGERPALCSRVTVTYEGSLISDGSTFDASRNEISFGLENLISGWQVGIPLIREGGRITLFIPSVYGYGTRGSGSDIPPNSNLRFEILLFAVR